MTNNMTSNTTKKSEEAAVYDRQIRLWGADAQARLQQAHVLYVHVTGASSEVLKNLVLAGVKATLWDPTRLDPATPNVLLTAQEKLQCHASGTTVAHALAPHVEQLNPLLGPCTVLEHSSFEELLSTPNTLSPFSVVVASRLSPTQTLQLKDVLPPQSHLMLVDAVGWNGVAVLALAQDYHYRPELGKQLLAPTRLEPYVSLEQLLAARNPTNRFHKVPPPVWQAYRVWWEADAPKDEAALQVAADKLQMKHVDATTWTGTHEVAPVCSVLGGLVGNEVLKVVSGKGQPAHNTILLDGRKAWSFLVR